MIQSFVQFQSEVAKAAPAKEYKWTKEKEISCDWLMDRIPAGSRGVDVGGTSYLCNKLAEKDVEATYFDLFPNPDFPNGVVDDMFNILDHFAELSLDFITTRHALEHSLVPMYQLWAYNKLLKDDGKLFVVVPDNLYKWIWFGTHFSCLPRSNWLMLFYRTGFRVDETLTASWRAADPRFIEHRFVLSVESRELRLAGKAPRDWRLRTLVG